MTRNSFGLSLIFIFCVQIPAFAKPWYAPQYNEPGVVQVWNSLEYYMTNANYDTSGGSFEKLPNGGSYKLLDWKFASRYYFTKELSAWGGFGLANAKSTSNTFDRNNTSLTDLSFGSQYRFRFGETRVIPEFIFLYPMNRIKADTDNVMTGEGAMVVEPAVWATYKWGPFTPFARAGIRYQDEGRALLLPWTAGLDWQIKTITVGLDVGGYNILKDDKNVNTPHIRDTVTTRVNGGSHKFYAVNPALLEVQTYAEGFITQSLFIRFGISKSINGKNTSEGMSGFFHLGWELGKISSEVPEEKKQNPFEVEERTYDEDLFDNQVKPIPAEEMPKPKRKKKKKKIDIDSVIRETERELRQ